jgi:hypothetical protein
VAERTRCVQWMQKALDQMNVQVHRAVTDLTGATGMAIVGAIVAGERDPAQLATHRDRRCRHSAEAIARYLTGTWRDEHLFNLASALRLFDALDTRDGGVSPFRRCRSESDRHNWLRIDDHEGGPLSGYPPNRHEFAGRSGGACVQ